MGKGSRQRKCQIPMSEYRDNWDRIFGKKDRDDIPDKKNCERKDGKENATDGS